MKDYAKHDFLKDIEVEGHFTNFTNAFLNTMAGLGALTLIAVAISKIW